MRSLSIFIWGLLISSILMFVAVVGAYWWTFSTYEISLKPENWGQFGDYAGGVLNPILSLFALAVILITLRIQMNELANQAKTAAISTDISYSTLVASNRAHVVCLGERYTSHSVGQTNKILWRYKINWANRGNTPAMACQIVVRFKLTENKLDHPKELNWATPVEQKTLSISPGAVLSSGAGHFPDEDLQKIVDGTHFLYIWGWCTYKDIFERTPIRRTQFAYESGSATGDPKKVWDSNLPFDLNLQHFGSANLVDEDCNDFLNFDPISDSTKNAN